MSKKLSTVAAVATAGALLIASAGNAEAAFKLRLTELGADRILGGTGANADTVVTIQDNGAGDLNGLPGVINYASPIGGFMVNFNIGLSKPALGSASTQQLHLGNLQLASVSGGTIMVDLTDTGFSSAVSPLKFVTEFGGAGTTAGSLSLEAYVSTDSQEFSKTGTQIADFSTLGPNQAMLAPVDADYSISLFSVISLSPFSSASFDAVVRVPEPQALALFGVGLLGLGFLARRRKAWHRRA